MSASAIQVCIGLGGNLGDVAGTIGHALQALDALDQTRLARRSPLYRTPAWGMTDQPDFINAAALLTTTLPADAILRELLRIECDAGRDRGTQTARWGPRALDLDLLLYGDAQISRPGLSVPHPHLHERAFVLVPLADIAPDLIVPGRGRVDELLAAMDVRGIAALA